MGSTASSTGKTPMITGQRYHFSALWSFSFGLILFSRTFSWNLEILSSDFLLKSEGIHKCSQEFYLCYQWYVFHVCHCWKICKSLTTICYLHGFSLHFFRIILVLDEVMVEVISFDVRRSFWIIFLFHLNILIRNTLLLRYFCAVCPCYA